MRSAILSLLCIAFVLPSRADELCGAVTYQCDLKGLELRLEFKEGSCPFSNSDSELSGVYDADHITKPIIKKCLLGKTPLTVSIIAGCSLHGSTVPTVNIYRNSSIEFEENGKPKQRVGFIPIEPIVHIPRLGFQCYGGEASSSMLFEKVVVKLKQSVPVERFSIEVQ